MKGKRRRAREVTEKDEEGGDVEPKTGERQVQERREKGKGKRGKAGEEKEEEK